jgi:phosphocarrier protein HPr
MIKKTLTICNKLGLHARASMKLLQLAERHASQITITDRRINRDIDAKDIMNLMALTAPCGTELTFSFSGQDETQAAKAIEELILNKFGENE